MHAYVSLILLQFLIASTLAMLASCLWTADKEVAKQQHQPGYKLTLDKLILCFYVS